jgi:hypothetical protein
MKNRSHILSSAIRRHWSTLGRPHACTIAVNYSDRDLLPAICADFNREHPFFKAIVDGDFMPRMSDSIALKIFYIASPEHMQYLGYTKH